MVEATDPTLGRENGMYCASCVVNGELVSASSLTQRGAVLSLWIKVDGRGAKRPRDFTLTSELHEGQLKRYGGEEVMRAKDMVEERLRYESRELWALADMVRDRDIKTPRELKEEYIPIRIKKLEDILKVLPGPTDGSQ